jgi:hypothetical protein
MVGNFFRVTCPYLYELDTVAYFALFRDRHSFQTIERIRATQYARMAMTYYFGNPAGKGPLPSVPVSGSAAKRSPAPSRPT